MSFGDFFIRYLQWLAAQRGWRAVLDIPYTYYRRLTLQDDKNKATVDFYENTGTLRIDGASSPLKFAIDSARASLEQAYGPTWEKIGLEAFLFLEEHDQYTALSATCLCQASPRLPEYSAVVAPFAKAFEGFCQKLLVKLGIVTQSEVSDPNWGFGQVWNDKRYETFVGAEKENKRQLERLKAELPYSRHRMLHGGFGPRHDLPTLESAKQKIDSIATLIRETFSHFHKQGLV